MVIQNSLDWDTVDRAIFSGKKDDGKQTNIEFCHRYKFPSDTWGLYNFAITKIYLYNFNPLKPHFYIAKLGFTGVYIIFLISDQKHKLWVLVRTASARRFYRVPTIYVLSRNMKNIRIFCLKIFIILLVGFQYV